MDSNEINKIAGAAICSLLVFLLLGFFSEQVFHASGGHGDEETLAFALEVEDAAAAPVEEELSLAELAAVADVAAGEKIFAKCKSCHKIEDGANGVGPHLWNVVGRKIAAVDGFGYSGVLGGMDGVWSVEALSGFLENPSGWAPGTAMGYAGLKGADNRVNLIAYLNEAGGSNIDLVEDAGGLPEASEEEAAEVEEPAESTETAAATQEATEEPAPEPAPAAEVAEEPAAVEPEPEPEPEAEVAAVEPEAETEAEPAGGGQYAALLAAANRESGEKVFRKCRACHNVAEGRNGVGPSLYGVVGADIASVDGYSYSDALKAVDGAWTLDNLMVWLENPKAFVAGNKMAYPGLRDPQDRIDVIHYLNEVDGSPIALE